jgi:hypothetical protein
LKEPKENQSDWFEPTWPLVRCKVAKKPQASNWPEVSKPIKGLG